MLADDTIFARDGVLGNIMLDAATGDELGPFDAGPPPAFANDVAFMLSDSTLTAVEDGGQGVNAWQFTGDGKATVAKCHVPKVVGEKLSEAKTKIRSGHCSVGPITRKTSSTAKRGRVLSQSPKPGETKARGAKVGLKVGKGGA